MRYLLPLLLVIALSGCASDNDVTLKARGDGLMMISYTIDGQHSETSAVGEFEQSYTGEPPSSFMVILTDEGGVTCEVVVNGSVVASNSQTGLAPNVRCEQ